MLSLKPSQNPDNDKQFDSKKKSQLVNITFPMSLLDKLDAKRGKITRADYVRRLIENHLSETGETPAEDNTLSDYDSMTEERTRLMQQQTRLTIIIDKTKINSKYHPMQVLTDWAMREGKIKRSFPVKELRDAIERLRAWAIPEDGHVVDYQASMSMIQFLENLYQIKTIDIKIRAYWAKHKPKAVKKN